MESIQSNYVSLPEKLKNEPCGCTTLFLRVFTSPLVWTVVTTAALAAFTAVALTGLLVLAQIIFYPVLGFGIVALGLIIILPRKKLSFEFHVAKDRIMNCLRYNWYNEIQPQLVLGAIPLKNLAHHEELTTRYRNLTVLGCVEPWENQNVSLVTDPVTPENWDELNVSFKQIETPDHYAVPQDKIKEGVEFIERMMAQGKTVYVHCKAGKARSATIVAAYLLKHKICPDAESAIAYIRERRPQIHMVAPQREAIATYRQNL